MGGGQDKFKSISKKREEDEATLELMIRESICKKMGINKIAEDLAREIIDELNY